MLDNSQKSQAIATSGQEQSQPEERESSELVNTLEKINKIIAPYFIVLVGLYLYNSNFLIGVVLVGTGILSLLKISLQDLMKLAQWLQKVFGLKEQ